MILARPDFVGASRSPKREKHSPTSSHGRRAARASLTTRPPLGSRPTPLRDSRWPRCTTPTRPVVDRSACAQLFDEPQLATTLGRRAKPTAHIDGVVTRKPWFVPCLGKSARRMSSPRRTKRRFDGEVGATTVEFISERPSQMLAASSLRTIRECDKRVGIETTFGRKEGRESVHDGEQVRGTLHRCASSIARHREHRLFGGRGIAR